MKKTKFFVPALLAMTLVGGAAFAGNAISAPHGGGHGEMHQGGPAGYGGHAGDMGGCMMGSMGDGPGYHRGMGAHMGRAYDNLTPEKRAQFDTMLKEYHSKVIPMGDALYVKKQELRALQNAATPDVNAVSKTAMEITELRNKVRAEKDAFMTKLDAELGIKDMAPRKGEGKGPRK